MRVNGQPERWLVAARLSRMSKRDRERGDEIINGIQTQDLRSAEWAKQEGHTIVHVTRDKNVSGAIPPWERPELGPWLTDPVKLVQYDGIVAYEVQRLSRGGNYDVAWLRRWAEQHNKKLYVIKERLRWPDRRDGMLWAVEAERAEQDRLDMTEKVVRELDALRAAGKLVGKPPFGFTTAGEKYDRRLVPTDAGLKYVPVIYQKVIDGWSGAKIAAWLNEEGVEGADAAWWQRKIGHLIRNPVYKGFRCAQETVPPDEVEAKKDGEIKVMPYTSDMPASDVIRWRYGKNWRDTPRLTYGKVIHQCQPLVDAPVWKRANDALDNRTIKGHLDPEKCAMLARCLYCPDCGDAKMYRIRSTNFRRVKGVGEQGKEDTRYQYYYCRGKGVKRPSCGMTVRVDLVDTAVSRIMEASFDVPVMENQIVYGNEAQVESELERIRWDIKQLGSQDLADDEYDARLAELRAERDRVAATVIVEDRVEMLPTEDTYLGIWNKLNVHERGPWLAEEGFRVYASKTEVTVSLGPLCQTLRVLPGAVGRETGTPVREDRNPRPAGRGVVNTLNTPATGPGAGRRAARDRNWPGNSTASLRTELEPPRLPWAAALEVERGT